MKLADKIISHLETLSKYIALVVCAILLLAAGSVIWHAFSVLRLGVVDEAVQDGLFVLILLEMFFVVKSFMKYGSINVGLVINVGVIATVKSVVFRLESLNWQLALAFGIVLLSLGFVYFMETLHYKQKKVGGI
ncbi:phosphate-starvation-inducible PsiE family protein [Candidatus Gracilibacteria bacterium]|nr:phosphate-starvation-inducible PsiE family protein [Candidatus Gracilibacteria bacterium]